MIYTGQSVRRFEDHRLLTGQSSFVDDMSPTRLLHAMVLRSPHAHAAIRSIDVSAVGHLPGVVAVFTAADIQDLAVHEPTRTSTDADELSPPGDLGSNVSLRTVSAGGDLDAAFAQAEHVVRQTYLVQRLAPAPMEPRGVIADYQPGAIPIKLFRSLGWRRPLTPKNFYRQARCRAWTSAGATPWAKAHTPLALM